MKKTFISAMILILCVNSGSFAQSGKNDLYDLKYKVKKGTEFTLRNMNISNSFAKTDSVFKKESSQTRDLIVKYLCVNVTDTSSEFEVEYLKKLYRYYNGQGQETITDFSDILGKKVRYTLSDNGVVSSFKGFSELPEVQMPGNWKYTGRHFQEEIEHFFPTLPDHPVEIGYTWVRNDFGVTIEYRIMDKVEMYGHDCLRIFARISGESTTTGTDRNGNSFKVDKNEPYTDIYYFAYQEGMIIYRFSVSSLGTQYFRNDKNQVIFSRETNTLYETFITFK